MEISELLLNDFLLTDFAIHLGKLKCKEYNQLYGQNKFIITNKNITELTKNIKNITINYKPFTYKNFCNFQKEHPEEDENETFNKAFIAIHDNQCGYISIELYNDKLLFELCELETHGLLRDIEELLVGNNKFDFKYIYQTAKEMNYKIDKIKSIKPYGYIGTNKYIINNINNVEAYALDYPYIAYEKINNALWFRGAFNSEQEMYQLLLDKSKNIHLIENPYYGKNVQEINDYLEII